MVLYPEKFLYASPPYEYEYEKLPLDLILGDQKLRNRLEQGLEMDEIEESWQQELEHFKQKRENYLLY